MRQMAVIDCFSTRVHPPQGETHAQTSDAYADRARRVCFGLHNNSAKFKSRRFSVSTAVFRESRLCTWLQTDKRVVVRLLTGLGQLRANEALKRPAGKAAFAACVAAPKRFHVRVGGSVRYVELRGDL